MKQQILKLLFITIDIISLVFLFYLTNITITNIQSDTNSLIDTFDLGKFYFIIFMIVVILFYERIYTFNYDFWQETHRIFTSMLLAYLIVLSILAISKIDVAYSRLFVTVYFAYTILFIPIVKRYSKKLIYSFDIFKNRILVVGSESQVKVLTTELEDNWYLGQLPVKEEFNSVIIVSKDLTTEKLNSLINTYLDNNRELYVVPYITDINFGNSNILEYANIRFNVINVENKLLIQRNIVIKKLFDTLVSIIILPIFLLLHLIISILIKLDSQGPIFFKQKRLGQNDKDFSCYKYRTMKTDGDEILKEYLNKNPQEVSHYEKYHKYREDPRVTKVGRFLRSTSLDELPQIINVIRGEMSLVGPRPYMINESEKLGENKNLILKVKPGMSGLWQVSGRNNLTFKERNELEVWYVRNWSLEQDIRVLLKTIKVVIGKGEEKSDEQV